MDNFKIDITSDGDILPALKMAFQEHRSRVWQKTAVGYALRPAGPSPDISVRGNRERPLRMVFFSYAPTDKTDFHPFPFKMDATAAAQWVISWLKEAPYEEEDEYFDGSTEKGWRVYNEDWGRVDGCHAAFIAVTPVLALYGK